MEMNMVQTQEPKPKAKPLILTLQTMKPTNTIQNNGKG
jgi:hypothetical protein